MRRPWSLSPGPRGVARLINEVRPPVIDEIGLEIAISHLVHEQRQRGGPKIEFHSDMQFGKLLPVLENAIYRIARKR